ncbi:MAG: hypothetical protein HKN39_07935 [Flavobacteriales bacterium]|nr:hypothetical protein [Flavobacteriales bacterium]
MIVLLFAQFSEAKNFDKININGNFIVIDGDHFDSRLELRNEYGAVKEIPIKKNGNFSFEAEKNKNYVLSFIKEGYINKEVIIDTHFDGDLKLGNVVFAVKLFPQASDSAELIYNEPVGAIRFVSGTEFVVEYNYSVALLPARMNF